MNIDEKFLNRLAETVKNVGGNERAARIIGKSVKSVERYKAGADPSFESLVRLADAAGVTLEWLAKGKGDPYSNKGLAEQKQSLPESRASEAIEVVVTALKKYMDDRRTNLTPESMGKASELLYHIYLSGRKIDDSIIEMLLSIKS